MMELGNCSNIFDIQCDWEENYNMLLYCVFFGGLVAGYVAAALLYAGFYAINIITRLAELFRSNRVEPTRQIIVQPSRVTAATGRRKRIFTGPASLGSVGLGCTSVHNQSNCSSPKSMKKSSLDQ